MSSGNGKRNQPNMRMKESQALTPPPQHDELIKFICDSWNKVNQEYQRGNAQGVQTVSYHNESEPNPQLKDFVPFDLEAWWGQRLVQKIGTQNT